MVKFPVLTDKQTYEIQIFQNDSVWPSQCRTDAIAMLW